jgi:hypothetical protein
MHGMISIKFMLMNFRVALSMGNFFTSLASVSASRRSRLVEVICMVPKNFVLLAVEKAVGRVRNRDCIAGPDLHNRNN